jgi:hypothetical protein
MNTKELRLKQRLMYVGTNSTRYVDDELGAEWFLSEGNNRFYVTAFSGTRGKPDFHFSYRSEAARAEKIDEWRNRLLELKRYRDEQSNANGGKRALSEAARCAAMIREELKSHFPDVKFTVSSANFSMGNSVSVSWSEGPPSQDVRSMISKYQYGHFDGMIDCYEVSNMRNDIPQAKYVTVNRRGSNE